jgi:hypothetical protein
MLIVAGVFSDDYDSISECLNRLHDAPKRERSG